MDVDGTIHKPVTKNDKEKLSKGVEISKEILSQAGVDAKQFHVTRVRAARSGGTAGMGRVVNVNHETEIDRLFVSDASVLPKAPGAPPRLNDNRPFKKVFKEARIPLRSIR